MENKDRRWNAVRKWIKSERKVSATSIAITQNPSIQTHIYQRNNRSTTQKTLFITQTLFIFISKKEILQVRQVPNGYSLVCGMITKLSNLTPFSQRVNFPMMVENSKKDIILTSENLIKANLVEDVKSNLTRLCGGLMRYENKYHLVVRVDLFGSALVRMPAAWVRRRKETNELK